MGIEPTWDSPHCPTPDLKSGSPTSELGTSGPIYNRIGSLCRGFWLRAEGSRQLAADSRFLTALETKSQGVRFQVSGRKNEKAET